MNLWRGDPIAARRRAGAIVALSCLASFGASAQGQEAPRAPAQTESLPIECWWKTDTAAVRVGEPFTLALTCGVVDTGTVRVAVDPGRLDPAALDVAPFEVLGGTRHQDIVAPPWRYSQYSYTLRLLGEEFFGRDVDIPALPLTYRVQSTGGNAEQGRDQLYLLPALPVRVISLVPVEAPDILDAPADTFADIESRSWRATQAFAAAGILFAFAAVLVGAAVARVVGRARAGKAAAVPPIGPHAVLRACQREGQRVKSASAAGWTPDLIERVLTVFRVAGAVALGSPIAETRVGRRAQAPDGQLAMETGVWRSKRLLVSAPTTAAAIAARLASDSAAPADDRETLEDIAAPLHVFGAVYYGRGEPIDSDALDSALDRGLRALQRMRVTKPWPVRAVDRLARRAAALREATWAR